MSKSEVWLQAYCAFASNSGVRCVGMGAEGAPGFYELAHYADKAVEAYEERFITEEPTQTWYEAPSSSPF